MGNRVSSMLQDEEIDVISQETGFSPAQIERLYIRFKSLDKNGICGSLAKDDFLRVPELAINPLCDRIVHMFFVDCDDDHDRINFRQFMKVLATFRSSARPANIKTRNVSRQDDTSENGVEGIENIFNSLSQSNGLAAAAGLRHSRHSSCDNFFKYHPVQHHTTNQHSIHYVASTSHLNNNHPAHHGHHGHHHHPSFHSSNNNNNYNNHNYNNHNGHNNTNGGAGPDNNHNSHNSSHMHHSQTHHDNHSAAQASLQSKCLLDQDEPANSLKRKLYFMFKIYDVNDDNLIDLEDLVAILKMMVGSYVEEARVRGIAERSLREADKDCDGFIDFEEFCATFSNKDSEFLRVKFSTLS